MCAVTEEKETGKSVMMRTPAMEMDATNTVSESQALPAPQPTMFNLHAQPLMKASAAMGSRRKAHGENNVMMGHQLEGMAVGCSAMWRMDMCAQATITKFMIVI